MKKILLKTTVIAASLLFFENVHAQKNAQTTLGVDPVFPSIAVNPANPVFNNNDVSFLNKDTAIAVGNNGMVWRSIDGGMNWTTIPTFTATNHNNSVIAMNNYICIAGDLGTTTFSNNRGATWQNAAAAQPLINYHGVHFADTTFGVSVGDAGDALVYHWIGSLGWAHIPTTFTQKLNAVAAFKTSASVFTDGSAIAVGDNGALATYAFGSWTNLAAPGSLNINGVYLFSDHVTVLAVGDSGLIMRSPDYGNSWSIIHKGTNEPLRDISSGITSNQFLAVGDSGVIYQSLDTGLTFTRYTVGFNTTNLKGVSAKSPRGAFGGSSNTLRVFAQDSTIITGVNDSLFCGSDNFKAYFKLFGLYGASNATSVELSDASGSFATPVVIGTKLNPNAIDSITCTIPANTIASSLYKIRLSTADPFILSNVYASSFTVLARPNNQTVQVNVTDLFVTSQGGCTYQWVYNNVPIGGATNPLVTTIGNGNYYVIITGTNGCTTNSNVFNYNTTSVKSITSTQITVSPNPASNMLTVNVPENMAGKTMHVFNTLGKKIDSEKLKAGVNHYNSSELEAGIYLLTIDTYRGVLKIKLLTNNDINN